MYVANSEPARWRRGSGRANAEGEAEYLGGSGTDVEADGIWVRACVLPGKPYWSDGQVARAVRKPTR
jgi:hypothetical protein